MWFLCFSKMITFVKIITIKIERVTIISCLLDTRNTTLTTKKSFDSTKHNKFVSLETNREIKPKERYLYNKNCVH